MDKIKLLFVGSHDAGKTTASHLDIAPEPQLPTYYDYLDEQHIQLPALAVDPRSQNSIVTLVQRFQ